MNKHTLFLGRTETGIFSQGLFSGALEKTAGAPGWGWESADEIRRFIRTIDRSDRKKNCYVLVNALGGGEWFGSNINADYFPWDALSHVGDDYGHKTFLDAHAFAHHVNKDPLHAFGVPVASVLNPRMKRVELIIKLDREKARKENADGVIARVDNGEFPDVSMGCKVPFDVCMYCGNESKTRDDYCIHMRPPPELREVFGPNKILPDGTKICVSNTRPRFFDISFVFIGADKTAKVMAKLASRGRHVCMGNVCIAEPHAEADPEVAGEPGRSDGIGAAVKTASSHSGRSCGTECSECGPCSTEKLAAAFGVKHAAQAKLSEMVKTIPSGAFSLRNIPALEQRERDLPDELLERLAAYPLPTSTGALTSAGMVLKPREFQRVVLIRMGHDDLADSLDQQNKVFRPVDKVDESVRPSLPAIDELLQEILPFVLERSGYGPPLSIRVIRLSLPEDRKKTLPTATPVEHPLLDKISAAYNGYRRHVLTKLSQAREEVERDPELRQAILGDDLVQMFAKTASENRIVTNDSVAYFMGAYLSNHCLLSTTAVASAMAVANPWLREELSA